MADKSARDVNRIPSLLGASKSDLDTVVSITADPVTRRLLVDSVVSSSLVPVSYDTILADYDGSDTDVYTYKYQGVTVATVTITYTDNSKAVLLSVIKT